MSAILKFSLIVFLSLFGMALSAFAADYNANHCEIFVDKVAAWSSTYGYTGVTFKIKTLNARLDGAIKMVGYRSILRSTPKIVNFCINHPPANGNSNNCDSIGKWVDRQAFAYFGSDYFKIDLELSHDYTFEHVYEGAFFVETVKGTRYWLHPAQGVNFFVDENLRSSLLMRGSGGHFKQGKDLNTADVFEYVNPLRCR